MARSGPRRRQIRQHLSGTLLLFRLAWPSAAPMTVMFATSSTTSRPARLILALTV
jgi:hypothetical protein